MKITGYRYETYLMKLDRPIADCNLPAGLDLLPGSVLYLETDEGVSGISLGFGVEGVAPLFHLIEGEDPREVLALWMKINDYIHKLGNEGAANGALSSIDIALWDLKAKLAGEPLWRTLGAAEGRVKAYASGLDYCLSDDELFTFYRRMAERGVDGGKLKVGLDIEADIRRLGIVRDALSIASDHPVLMIDSNEYWSPKQSVRFIRRMEQQFDIAWAEEPARRWDYEGLRLVSRQVSAAVATGENLNSVADFYPLVANRAVDVLNVAAGHSGITGCRQIANLALAYGLPVSMMNCQAEFMAHAAAAMPNHVGMEVVDPGREQCLRFDSHIDDGYIVLGEKPGLGVEVDEVALAALKADPPTGRGQFPFARREGASRYIVPPQPGEVSWETSGD
jgi:L-alanine-DL-glutamate epimerase-like enolase superfamily enzyme